MCLWKNPEEKLVHIQDQKLQNKYFTIKAQFSKEQGRYLLQTVNLRSSKNVNRKSLNEDYNQLVILR